MDNLIKKGKPDKAKEVKGLYANKIAGEVIGLYLTYLVLLGLFWQLSPIVMISWLYL